MIDSPKRSITKAASWRLFALIFLSLISFLITGDEKKALIITVLYHSIQIIFYFIHERVWTRIDWGKTSGLCIQMTGMSGAGKSTIINLLPRFYDPNSGEIFIDDQNISNVTLSSLRRVMSLVSQDIILFDDTVQANIAYANLNASKKQMDSACELSLIHI